MAELKPCPFCGCKAIVFSCDGSGSFYSHLGQGQLFGRKLDHKLIRCQKCGVRTKAYKTGRGLFNAWNRRAEDVADK